MDPVCDVCGQTGTTDPNKRVRYVRGLVLGVSEFNTEQGYFLEKGRRHNRALHGYGTISGLAISIAGTATEPEVRIEAGLAVDAMGREICVPEAYCAPLNEWLARQPAPEGEGSPPDEQTAYVVLCYRECPTDTVPIPVGPCHSLDKSSVPSRLLDAFELRLTVDPPAQAEEDSVRALGDLLAAIRVGDGPGALTTPDELVDAIRALIPETSLPDGSPPSIPSIPSFPDEILLDPLFAAEILDVAMRVWVTDVRPFLNPDGGACIGGADACVLLGRIDFDTITLVDGTRQVNGPIDIDETDRPYLLQTRVLQEGWLALAPQALAEAAVPPPPVAQIVSVPLPPAAAAIINNAALVFPTPERPALRVSLGGGFAFPVVIPEGTDPAIAPRLRLYWTYQDTGGLPDPLQVTWAGEFNVFAAGDDLTIVPPQQGTVTLAESVALAPDLRLQAIAAADLAPAPGVGAGFGSLTIRFDTDPGTDGLGTFFYVMGELVFTLAGSGGSV